MSQPSKKQKKATTTSLQRRVLLDDANKFVDLFLSGTGCTNFFNAVIKRDDIEFMPTKADINPEDYEGDDAEEDGDEYPDAPIYWSMIRHMSVESKNWIDLRRALKNSQKFAFHEAQDCCFFGFVGDCGWAEGYAGDPDFQELVADFHGQ